MNSSVTRCTATPHTETIFLYSYTLRRDDIVYDGAYARACIATRQRASGLCKCHHIAERTLLGRYVCFTKRGFTFYILRCKTTCNLSHVSPLEQTRTGTRDHIQYPSSPVYRSQCAELMLRGRRAKRPQLGRTGSNRFHSLATEVSLPPFLVVPRIGRNIVDTAPAQSAVEQGGGVDDPWSFHGQSYSGGV